MTRTIRSISLISSAGPPRFRPTTCFVCRFASSATITSRAYILRSSPPQSGLLRRTKPLDDRFSFSSCAICLVYRLQVAFWPAGAAFMDQGKAGSKTDQPVSLPYRSRALTRKRWLWLRLPTLTVYVRELCQMMLLKPDSVVHWK